MTAASMKKSQTLIVRADANVTIGTGHVMRCLALAQAWQDVGGSVVFAMAESTPAVDERLRSESVKIVPLKGAASDADAAEVAELTRLHQANWVVVDGYRFDAAYQNSLKESGLKVLFVDDNDHADHYFADLVLNQNVYANEAFYPSRENYTRLLLGPRYAMLRREFRPWRDWKREIAPVGRKVLVTMGGSDPENVTGRVVEALRMTTVEGLEATVVVGGSNPHLESLEKAGNLAGAIRFVRDTPDMPELMAWADVAVSAAGTTSLEMCLLGLPAILIDVAANQTPGAEVLDQKGIAIHLGSSKQVRPETIVTELESLLLSQNMRIKMSEQGKKLVDGQGAGRVIQVIGQLNCFSTVHSGPV